MKLQTMNLNTMEKAWVYTSLKAIRKGRNVLMQYWGKLERVEEKHLAGLVSEADQESEIAIKKELDLRFPEFDFLGEESWFKNQDLKKLSQSVKPRWILDPLDGTTNYVHRFPVFCISLGLEINNEVVMGIVDVPMLNETYVAVKGRGAFLNGNRISVSSKSDLKTAFLSTGFFPEDEKNLDEQLKYFSRLVRSCRAVRRPGAAAYDLALVAAGVFDGFWEKNLKPWDSAAGLLLVREAGGVVKTYDNQEYNPYNDSILATTPQLLNSLLQHFKN